MSLKRFLENFGKNTLILNTNLRLGTRRASKAIWTNPSDIKSEYSKASILKSGRVVFNICGNKYRLVVEINYERLWVFIRFIGTHTDYDKIDANKI